ncbi:tripartite tricarboxylate transporter TctB family protein [Agrococcus sp. ARC_14]|uniref:tripartite tricarboxylate transporter TctB family protein n=1 Tax=Agrococcus sp. ARC_14 TaxID=2919927 RepID=UPI001F05DC02|nr:tripartite tricarboxylate transporter TctB family protein [Agrococcus sp. ARC_14]MCH1881913.1 tripartite tricarboxylate transporter TctB family protein [Agrococcus sp. ARC_14]
MQHETSAHNEVAEEIVDEFVEVETDLPVTTGYRIANQVAAALAVLIGAWMAWSALELGLVAPNGTPGAGVFPLAIGTLFGVLGLAWFVLASLGRLDRSADTQFPDRAGIRRILITAVATGVFLWALLWIGYLLAMALYTLALLVLVGDRKWWSSAIIAAVFSAGSYYAFTVGLNLSLPRSAFAFISQFGI